MSGVDYAPLALRGPLPWRPCFSCEVAEVQACTALAFSEVYSGKTLSKSAV
jgi:hypothetical protein